MRFLLVVFAFLLPLAASAQSPKAGRTQITWLGHSAFLVQTPGGANLLIDPWLQGPTTPKNVQLPQQIDAVLVSHGHGDHVGDAVNLAKKSGGQLLAVNELAKLLGWEGMGGNVGGTFQVKDATVHFVEARHSSSYAAKEGDVAQYAGDPIGFVIEIKNGPTLYHAGDTGLFGGMDLIGKMWPIDYALLPIGGHFTMGPVEAATAVRLLGAKTVVPMHYGTFGLLKGTPEELQGALSKGKSKAKMQVLQPGKATAL